MILLSRREKMKTKGKLISFSPCRCGFLAKKGDAQAGRSLTAPRWNANSPPQHRGNTGGSSEEDVSAAPKKPETHARFPEAHEHPCGARNNQPPSPQRAQEAYRNCSQEIGCGDRPAPGAWPQQATPKAVRISSRAAARPAVFWSDFCSVCHAAVRCQIPKQCTTRYHRQQKGGQRGCAQSGQALGARKLSQVGRAPSTGYRLGGDRETLCGLHQLPGHSGRIAPAPVLRHGVMRSRLKR
jgi:hypothetical protein